ncbi:HAMP domain-containing histidine kinase [Blautia schinkii]|nr:HAMP domain-containing histidine kinase [Blautia schinkii]
MKRKRYRGKAVKAALIVIVHITVILSVLCTLFTKYLFDQGITFKDLGKTYVESRHFERDVYRSAKTILDQLQAQLVFPNAEGSQSKTVELDESIPGLSYSTEDLLDWAADPWEYNDYSEGRNILKCVNNDGTYTYFYYNDFASKIYSGELNFVLKNELRHSGSSSEDDDLINSMLEQLKYGQISQDSIDSIVVTDDQKQTKYVDVFAYPGDSIREKYAPIGASSILEVLNTNPKWNDRIDEAYSALESLLTAAARSLESSDILSAFKQGSTNLTYLYIDKDNETALSNISTYQDYQNADSSLEKLISSGIYFIMRPQLADCETNFASLSSQGSSAPDKVSRFQSWHHLAEVNSKATDYIFVVQVNTDFPVNDSIADAQSSYDKYAKWLFPTVIGGIIALLVFLIVFVWLTKAAGRRPEDEEIHLCAADRLYAESGLLLLALWAVSVTLFANGYHLYNTPRIFIFSGITAFFTTSVFLIIYLSLVRRLKAKVLWKNSLLNHLARKSKTWSKSFPAWFPGKLKSIKAKLKKLVQIYSRNTGSKVKITILLSGILLLQFFIIMLFFNVSRIFILVLIAVDAIVLIYAVRKADGREKLVIGLKKISSGELQYKIPAESLSGEQRTMADYINNIGAGLDAAVENSLKNERMKTELITNVSHDIKTPLTSIINYVGLLKRENFTDKKICGYLDILEEKAQRLKALTEDVVEASKASTGNITLEMADLDFVEMLQQVIGEFEEKFRKRNLSMMVHFSDGPSVVYADGRRMWRVLENIFNNVVKYALEGTRVYAEVKKSQNPDDQKVIFSLKNISAQPLNISADELTERFIRGDVARNTEGSGLGLSIAKSLTELQGGEFKLYVDGDLFKVTITFSSK